MLKIHLPLPWNGTNLCRVNNATGRAVLTRSDVSACSTSVCSMSVVRKRWLPGVVCMVQYRHIGYSTPVYHTVSNTCLAERSECGVLPEYNMTNGYQGMVGSNNPARCCR